MTAGRRAPARAPRAARRAGISFEDMAARRAERLVNLVICLLSTRQFLTAERIRDAVPGLRGAPTAAEATDEAFKRMFERDKAELRDLGIPLETGRNSHFDTEDGYRIKRGDYELPPIEFDAAEAAAVGLAGRLWQSATLGEPARAALIKLRAAGTDGPGRRRRPARCPHLDASDPSLPALLDAARTARVVRFDYIKSGAGAAQTPHARTVGRAVLARAVVRRRVRPRPRRAAQLPALAHRRPGRRARRARRVRTARGRRPARRWWRTRRRRHPRRARAGHRRRRRVAAPGRRRRTIDGVARRSPTPTRTGWPGRSRRRARPRSCSTRPSSSTPSSPGCARPPGSRRDARRTPTSSGCRGCSRSSRTCRRTRASRSPRPPPTSASPSSSCAATCSCCGCAGCPATARAT